MSKIHTRIVEAHGDFSSPHKVLETFAHIVGLLKGVHILRRQFHIFINGGVTALFLLNESHAAMHTWPEHNYGWFELATCGNPNDCDLFEKLIHTFFAAPVESAS